MQNTAERHMPQIHDKIIQDMLNRSHASEEQKLIIKKRVIMPNIKQLAMGLDENYLAGNSLFIPHEIKLTHDRPIWTPQYLMGHKEREIMRIEIQKQLKGQIIEETTDMTYNSPVMCTKEGSWCMEACY